MVKQSRYPSEYDLPENEDVVLAINDAKQILIFVKKKVAMLPNPNMTIF